MATRRIEYGTPVDIDIDPEGLASSATRVAGVESAVQDNSSSKLLDALVGGRVMTGTTPTAGRQIDIWVYAAWKGGGSPIYPDVLDGTKSAETLTSENVRNSALALAHSIIVDSTSNVSYPVKPFSIAELFGGVMPEKWGLFLSHDTVAALHATGTNFEFWHTPITETIT